MYTCLHLCDTVQDLVAVGYGKFSASDESIGLICCWSLKNPEVCACMYMHDYMNKLNIQCTNVHVQALTCTVHVHVHVC